MNIRIILICVAGLLLMANQAFSQFGLQVGNLGNRIWSQTYNPARLSSSPSGSIDVGVMGTGWFGNNNANIAGIFAENNVITQETADRLVGELSTGNALTAGYALDLLSVNLDLGSRRWGFYIGSGLNVSAEFNEAKTLGLVLKGNGPYKGDTIQDSDITANFYQVNSIGAATTFDINEKLKLGVRLNLLQGSRIFDLEESSYQLYTSSNGTQVDLDANYAFRSSPDLAGSNAFSFNGFGGSLNAGLTYQVNEKIQLEAAVTDLGLLSWTTDKKSRMVELDAFEGIFIENVLADDLSGLIENEVDSLTALITPDSTRESYTMLTPVRLRLGAAYDLNEDAQVIATLIYSPLRQGAHTPLPLLNVTYQHEILDGFMLGANAYGGGYDTYGFGLMGTYRIETDKFDLDLLVGSDNLTGLLVPSVGRGMSAYGGVGVTFGKTSSNSTEF